MSDQDSKSEVLPEEPVVTKLISSKDQAIPPVEAWQLSRFDQKEKAEEAVISERVSKEVQKQIEPELQKRAELLKKDAYDSAYQQGYEAGFSAGTEDGRAEAKAKEEEAQKEAFTPKLEQVLELISGLEMPYKDIQNQVLSELVDLSLHVAHEVIQKELSGNKEWLLKAIQDAVKVLPDDSLPYSVELNPTDIALLEEGASPSLSDYQLKPNSTVLPGTCLVQQQNTSILNSWKERFDEASSSLTSKASS